MSIIFFIVGLVFLIPSLLSIADITDVGLDYISLTKIHTLPFINQYPSAWIYVVLGLILMIVGFAISRRR